MNTNPQEDNLANELSKELPISAVPEDLLAVFCETMQEDLTKLDEAINTKDIIAMRSLAHRMKGAFEVLGISSGTSACKQIGILLTKSDFTKINIICVDLRHFLNKFIA